MSKYKIANDSVVWEKIGEQIVIADLKTGSYANIHHAGVVIWEHLIAGIEMAQTIAYLKDNYQNFDAAEESPVMTFIEELKSLGYIELTEDSLPGENQLPSRNEQILPYIRPQLLVYDDFNTLLLLDPIDDEFETL